jgi:hypothetical protein
MADEGKHSSEGQQATGSSGSSLDWTVEEAYWREHHSKQAYADKDRSYEDYAAAYRVGAEGAEKYRGRDYDEVEHSLATDYQHAEAGSAIPWDTVRPAVRAAWDRLSGVIGPRDSDRGTRSGF